MQEKDGWSKFLLKGIVLKQAEAHEGNNLCATIDYVLRKPQTKAKFQIWYSNAAFGKNSIGTFLVTGAKAAGLPGNESNHFDRKTCISCLMNADIPVNNVVQLRRHKNLKLKLGCYKAASSIRNEICQIFLVGQRPHRLPTIVNQYFVDIDINGITRISNNNRLWIIFLGKKLAVSKAVHSISTLLLFVPIMPQ